MSKVQRNALCPCGSGKKYKYCCMRVEEESTAVEPTVNKPLLLKVIGVALFAGIAAGFGLKDSGSGVTIFFAVGLLAGGYVVLRKPPPSNPNSGDPSSLNFGR